VVISWRKWVYSWKKYTAAHWATGMAASSSLVHRWWSVGGERSIEQVHQAKLGGMSTRK